MQVLKFGAVWCSGCLVMKPIWKELEQANPWLQTTYYDYDQDKEAVAKHSVDDILPTFVFLDQSGHEFLRLTGEVSQNELEKLITEHKDK